ncbi:DMT family transporter [Vreelandella aquamarina]|jgi:drug/metabolite transporter (DMT)-like permease|uniref:Permease of the drug/metabolite transporter (DMT) superfamily n=2 Tax=Gammaproteobacteria TaxID=1236 RepID=A0A1N6CQV8_9GAMM|nr:MULTISPECIES: DMT family transporter [Halomonas]HAO00812.1 EamA/RhaT family transporter [Halomonas sp.]MCC4288755.1 DMT family transporter [Halomonas meridiana]SIN60744.1 Permease of the drug/metabolite transporter (DMT) superfamily [Halomonas meridiana]SIN68093.1 Permease of the drug/metabolite transporter (DMT) superfamily [Halomonas meridiana]SIO30074.1 Permease of the drug/metabolite transporter (DMT) superfamily [Halomonas meridiana]|tara:strand:+ start:6864 stop:7808 length:945 start_codon:yes stop_codon:yes gene_type:complete
MSFVRVQRYMAQCRDSGQLSAIALIGTIGLFWGGNWPAVRFILMDIPPFTLRSIGFTTGAILLLGWAYWRRLPIRVSSKEWPWLAITGFFTILGFNLATAFGQLRMPTSQAAIIAFSMPCWALLLGWWLLDQPITKRQWLGLACGQGGLLILLGPSALQGGVQGLIGPLIMLGAALSWALGTVLIKRRGGWESHAVVVTGWQFVLCAIPMIILMIALEPIPSPTNWQTSTWLALCYHLLFSITLAQMLWFMNVNQLTIAQATISTLIIPTVGVSSAILLLGEPLSPKVFIALLLTLSAVAIVMFKRSEATSSTL